MHVFRVLTIVIQVVSLLVFIRAKLANDIITISLAFGFILANEEICSFIKWSFLGEQHGDPLL